MPQTPIYGDAHFCRQTEMTLTGDIWYNSLPRNLCKWVQPDASCTEGIVFLSDPQLRGAVGQRARELLQMGAIGVMTGTPDAGSFSSELLANGQMEFWRYPVHLNETQCAALAVQNYFAQIVRYHSPDFPSPGTIVF